MARYEYIPSLYDIRFELPETNRQSDEFFYATVNGEQLRFNIHDYDTLYAVPWLYDIALYHGLVQDANRNGRRYRRSLDGGGR